MSDHIMIAFSSPKEGQEEEFLDWYRGTHMPEVCDVEGIEGGTFYEIDPASPTQPARFFSMYDLSAEPRVVLANMMQRRSDGLMGDTDTMDPASGSLMFCRKRFSS